MDVHWDKKSDHCRDVAIVESTVLQFWVTCVFKCQLSKKDPYIIHNVYYRALY